MPVFKEMYRVRQDLKNLNDKLEDLQTICEKNCDQSTAQQIKETIEVIGGLYLRLQALENLSDKFHH